MKYNLRHQLISLYLFFFACNVILAAEHSDTISRNDTVLTQYSLLRDFQNNLFGERQVDKNLNGFQIYLPINKSLYYSLDNLIIDQFSCFPSEFGYKAHLGNLGTATNRIVFEKNTLFGINSGFTSFNDYIQTSNNTRFYNVKKPYTELYYVAGAKREQIFKIEHAQTLKTNLKLGFNFTKTNSTGFYTHHKSDHSNFSTQLQYTSKNKRYNLLVNSIFNNISSQENGGLVSDSIYEEVVNVTKSAIPVYLDSAENNWKGQSHIIKQFYFLGKKETKIINDTIDSISFIPKSQLYHSIGISTWKRAFNDYFPDINYYPAIYYDSLVTADTLFSNSLKQTIGWSNTIYNNSQVDSTNPIVFQIEISHEYAEFHQNKVDSFLNNFWINTVIAKKKSTGLSWKAFASYMFLGNNLNDFKLGGLTSYQFGQNNNRISIFATYQNNSPAYLFQRFDSNHFKWNNKFSKTAITKVRFDYCQIKNKLSMGLKAYLIDRYIYLNELSLPTQMGESVGVYGAYIRKDFTFGKWTYNPRLVYQIVDKSTPIRIPDFSMYQSISFSDWLFKKALFVKLGFDVYYNSAYYSDAYSPALASFYIQNQKEIGNYPFLDFFACFRIKKARLFFLVSHLNAGWLESRNYLTPHYPSQDLSLKFGASWMFYD